eukprot:3118063-Rhodomonas_salina.2
MTPLTVSGVVLKEVRDVIPGHLNPGHHNIAFCPGQAANLVCAHHLVSFRSGITEQLVVVFVKI